MARSRIVVADDNLAFLEILVSMLSIEYDVVATARDGISAVESIRRYEPDLVILDLRMPVWGGMDVLRSLVQENHQRPPIVICSTETDPEVVEFLVEMGALGYVFKRRIEEDLVPAVKSVLQGKKFVSDAH